MSRTRLLLMSLVSLLGLHWLVRVLHHPPHTLRHYMEDPRSLLQHTVDTLEDLELQIEAVEDEIGEMAKASLRTYIGNSPPHPNARHLRPPHKLDHLLVTHKITKVSGVKANNSDNNSDCDPDKDDCVWEPDSDSDSDSDDEDAEDDVNLSNQKLTPNEMEELRRLVTQKLASSNPTRTNRHPETSGDAEKMEKMEEIPRSSRHDGISGHLTGNNGIATQPKKEDSSLSSVEDKVPLPELNAAEVDYGKVRGEGEKNNFEEHGEVDKAKEDGGLSERFKEIFGNSELPEKQEEDDVEEEAEEEEEENANSSKIGSMTLEEKREARRAGQEARRVARLQRTVYQNADMEDDEFIVSREDQRAAKDESLQTRRVKRTAEATVAQVTRGSRGGGDAHQEAQRIALEEIAKILNRRGGGETEKDIRTLRRVQRHFLRSKRRRDRQAELKPAPPPPPYVRYSREQALLRDAGKLVNHAGSGRGVFPANLMYPGDLISRPSIVPLPSRPSVNLDFGDPETLESEESSGEEEDGGSGAPKPRVDSLPSERGGGSSGGGDSSSRSRDAQSQMEAETQSSPCSNEVHDIPNLEGVAVVMPEVRRRDVRTRRQVAVSPRKDAFVHQDNMQFQMSPGSETAAMLARNPTLVPLSWEVIEQQYDFRSCAAVGNSGILKHSSFGRAINTHDVVVRLNQAPTTGYARYVGKKTVFRILNQKWADNYATMTGRRRAWDTRLPLEPNVTLIVSRSENGPQVVKALVDRLRQVGREDVKVLLLSPRFVRTSRQALAQYREKLCSAGYGPWPGGSTPSSGIVATLLLLQLCENTQLYGFGEYRSSRDKAQYHYYSGLGSLKSGYDQHSWPAESALISQLVRESYLASCAPKAALTTDMAERKDADHNLACGINTQIGVDAVYKVIAQAKADQTVQ